MRLLCEAVGYRLQSLLVGRDDRGARRSQLLMSFQGNAHGDTFGSSVDDVGDVCDPLIDIDRIGA